jgi:hypothetical protein
MNERILMESLSDHRSIPKSAYKVSTHYENRLPGGFLAPSIIHAYDSPVYTNLYTVGLCMVKQQLNDDDFELLEFGGPTHYQFPVLSIYSRSGAFNKAAYDQIISKEKAHSTAFARTSQGIYVSFLPELSEIKGYQIKHAEDKHYNGGFSSKNLISKFGIQPGYYKILTDESIFKKDIQWYPLEVMEVEDGNS